jgi:hypothetical protein
MDMRQIKIIGAVALATLALNVALTSSASASEKLLTFYANGEAIPTGPPWSDSFTLETTLPVKILIPQARLAMSCAADSVFEIGGWFESNGLSTDVVQTNQYTTGPVRECSGASFGGLIFDGTTRLSSNGVVEIGRNEVLEYSPQLAVNGCYYFGNLWGVAKFSGPLTVTLRGIMRSTATGCPRAAYVAVGPLDGFYGSDPVEGRVSP